MTAGPGLAVAVAVALVTGAACGRDEPPAPGAPRAVGESGPQGREAQFVVECTFSHAAPDDPIVHPGHSGMSHLHTFFGNATANADSTYESLASPSAATTCDQQLDRASYWAPALTDDGTLVEPTRAVAYYRVPRGVAAQDVVAYPPGLMAIAGDATASEPQPLETVAWSCGTGSVREPAPPTCPDGRPLRLQVRFPACWDGERVDSDDHRSHLAYAGDDGCPSSHPVATPELTLAIDYPITGAGHHLTLASGSLHSGHADFFNAWDAGKLETEVELCLRRGMVCGVVS